jgi:hypothetical protein
MKIILVAAIVLGAVAVPAGYGETNRTQIDIVVDMTSQGRKVQPPSHDKPAFYIPYVRGYVELGKAREGTDPPPPLAVEHQIALELARDGYFVISKASPIPSFILVIQWGCANPVIGNFNDGDASQKRFFNEGQMLAIVGGNTLEHMDLDFNREQVMQGAEQDRYFVALTAFDYKAYSHGRKKVKLWEAKMSLPSTGVMIDDAIPALVRAGGPLFGRETTRPKMLILPLTPEGRVIIGTPTVKDYQDALPPPAPAFSPTGSQTPDAKPQ